MQNLDKFPSKIGIIGCGNLGASILNGLLTSGKYHPEYLWASKRNLHTISHFQTQKVNITSKNIDLLQNTEIILLALKPYNILPVLQELKPYISEKHCIVSLATGINITEIEAVLGNNIPVMRAMPNTASHVSESITSLCTNSPANTYQKIVTDIFNTVGETLFIEEKLMEAVTILGACGIAYVLRFIRAMVQGGIQIGFNSETASKIVNQVVKGASSLLIEENTHPEQEIDKVTTPKGCTIVGLNEMEHNGFSSSLIKGIVSSFKEIEKE